MTAPRSPIADAPAPIATSVSTADNVIARGADAVRIADDLTPDEIADHLAITHRHLVEAEAQWPGLVSLPADDRNGNLGKLVAQLSPALRALFDALTPVPGEDPHTTKSKQKLLTVFNATVGDADRGHDPEVFEVALLATRLTRVEAEQAIVNKLEKMRKHFADDLLNTGEMVVGPGLQAIDVARTISSARPEFRSLLAPVLNALKDMTKDARAEQNRARTLPEQLNKATASAAKTTIKANTEIVRAQFSKDALAAELAAMSGEVVTPPGAKR